MAAPEILVIGAGAVGAYFGGRLAQHGANVSVVVRSDCEELSRNGGVYHIESHKGDFEFRPARILRNSSECPVRPDYILLSPKVLPGLDQTALCKGAAGKGTCIVTLQNGIGNEAALAEAFPECEILGAITYIGVSRPAPAKVLHKDFGRITLGRYPEGASASADSLAELFRNAGVECKVVEDIVRERWGKLLWNASFNPISVLGRSADTNAIMSNPEVVVLAEGVMLEIAEIAKSEGYELPRSMIDRNISLTREMLSFKTSMLQDFESGRALEADAILGVPLSIARRNGVPAPRIHTLYALLKLATRN